MNVSAHSALPSHWSIRGLQAVAGMAVAAAITFAGGIGLWSYQTHRQERAIEVTKFLDVARQFDGKFTAFMTPFLAGQDDKAERIAVRNNIQDQFKALEGAANSLEGERFDLAMAYKAKLVTVATELDRNQPAPEAKTLMQAVAAAKDAEVCVTYYLRDEAGLDTSAKDEKDCSID